MADKLNKKLVDDNNFVAKRLNSANDNLTNKKKDREKNKTKKEEAKEQRKLQRKQDIHTAGQNIKNAATTVAHPIKSTKNAISDSRERRKDAKNQKKEQKDLEKEYKAYKKSENKKNKELAKEARHERRAEGIKKLGNSVVDGGKSIGNGINNGIQAVKHTKEVGAKGVAKEVGSAVKNKAKGLKNNTAKSISNRLNYKKQDVKNAFNRQKPVRAFKAVRDINRFRKEKGLKATAKAFGTMLKSGASDVLDNIINSKAVQFIIKHKTSMIISAGLTTSVVGMSSIAIGYGNTLKGSPSYYCAQGANVPAEIVNSAEYQLYCLGNPCGIDNNKTRVSLGNIENNLNNFSDADYIYGAISTVTKQNGWTQNASIGLMAYIMQEGGMQGSFTYESYNRKTGPSGVVNDKTLDNQAWLDWLSSKETQDWYYSDYRAQEAAGGGDRADWAIGIGLMQWSDVSGGTSNATNLIKAANEENVYWQDLSFQIDYILKQVENSNDSDLNTVDVRNDDLTADEWARRITAGIGMPGWNWNESIAGLDQHARHVDKATEKYSSGGAKVNQICKSGGNFTGDLVFWEQWGQSWSPTPWAGCTIHSCGCGLAAMTEIVDTITGNDEFNPGDMANFAKKNGISESLSLQTYIAIAKMYFEQNGYDVSINNVDMSIDTIKEVLDKGGLIQRVATYDEGTIPYSGGHHFAIFGYDNDGVYTGDSGLQQASTKTTPGQGNTTQGMREEPISWGAIQLYHAGSSNGYGQASYINNNAQPKENKEIKKVDKDKKDLSVK